MIAKMNAPNAPNVALLMYNCGSTWLNMAQHPQPNMRLVLAGTSVDDYRWSPSVLVVEFHHIVPKGWHRWGFPRNDPPGFPSLPRHDLGTGELAEPGSGEGSERSERSGSRVAGKCLGNAGKCWEWNGGRTTWSPNNTFRKARMSSQNKIILCFQSTMFKS